MKTKQHSEIQFHWIETRHDKIKQLITDVLLELHVDEDLWERV